MHNLRQHAGTQVRWCLHAHGRAKNQPSHGDGPEQFVQIRFRRVNHFGFSLGAEILHDDFLHMAVLLVNVANGQQAFDTLQPSFADTD